MTMEQAPSVGGFLYVTVASLIAGLILNVIRWALFDVLNAMTGINSPDWDDSNLQDNLQAFQNAVEQHFRYYQFYACMLIAVAMVYVVHHFIVPEPVDSWIDLPILIFFALFGFAQRDALRRYFARTSRILNSGKKPPHDKRKSSNSQTRRNKRQPPSNSRSTSKT